VQINGNFPADAGGGTDNDGFLVASVLHAHLLKKKDLLCLFFCKYMENIKKISYFC
jgi:hypothetical protein